MIDYQTKIILFGPHENKMLKPCRVVDQPKTGLDFTSTIYIEIEAQLYKRSHMKNIFTLYV